MSTLKKIILYIKWKQRNASNMDKQFCRTIVLDKVFFYGNNLSLSEKMFKQIAYGTNKNQLNFIEKPEHCKITPFLFSHSFY